MCLKLFKENFNIILALVIIIILVHVYMVNTKAKFSSGDKFIMYHTTWCGHSKRAKEEFDKLGSIYNGVSVEDIDCDIDKRLCDTEMISSYPTFKLHKSNEKIVYDNSFGRTEQGFRTFLDEN